MKMREIMNFIYSMSDSQGFYSRLWFTLCTMEQNDPERFKEISRVLEEQNFKDPVDLVLYLES